MFLTTHPSPRSGLTAVGTRAEAILGGSAETEGAGPGTGPRRRGRPGDARCSRRPPATRGISGGVRQRWPTGARAPARPEATVARAARPDAAGHGWVRVPRAAAPGSDAGPH